MLKTSVIIPTYHRPQELSDLIQSLLWQTKKPDELIIIDDGNLSEVPFEQELNDAAINLIYHKKDVPGLTESRNAGIRKANGDIIFFFDDDVILSTHYLQEIIKTYESDPGGKVGGVGGMMTNPKSKNFTHAFRKILEIIFLVSGLREGRVLRSGFFTDLLDTDQPILGVKEVEFLPGCALSFRRKIFKEFIFTDRYRSYGFGEDKDFTYQVSKKYKLLINRSARLQHLESEKMRPEKKGYGKKFVIGRYLFFRDHVKNGWWDWLLFSYALFGYTLIRAMVLLVSPGKNNIDHLLGIFEAVEDIIAGRVMPV